MKRYIYIIIGIIVLAAIAIAVLLFIKNNSSGNTSPGAGGAATSTGSLPVTGTQGQEGTSSGTEAIGLPPVTSSTAAASPSGQTTVQNFGVLSSSTVLDYFVDARNNITAIEPTGAVIAITNGKTTTINSSTINDIISASFSYDGKKILVSYGSPTNPETALFDVASNSWTAISQTMLSPQWSPANNYRIAYLTAPAAGTLTLATINAASPKTAPSSLLTLDANDLDLQWPAANEFILSDKPSRQDAGSIWAFNSSAGTLLPVVYEAAGTEGIWSHNAAIPYGLTFFNNPAGQGGSVLQLQALSGGLPTQPLSLSTLPSKCIFDTESMPAATSTAKAAPTSTPYLALYCGVPRSSSGFSSANLPDDYNTMALFTSDDIYKINTATGAEQVLWSVPAQNMDVSDVKFANNALFFVNRYDQKLYGLTFSQ